MRRIGNVFWLMGTEFRVLWRDLVLLLLVVYSFGPGMYMESSGGGSGINNTAVTFVDEDRSSLSRALQTALYPPAFLPPTEARPDQIERMLDWGETTFVVVVPAGFEADVRAGRTPTIQINIDATKTMQASVGTGHLTTIMSSEVQRFAARADLVATPAARTGGAARLQPGRQRVWLVGHFGAAEPTVDADHRADRCGADPRTGTRHDRTSDGDAAVGHRDCAGQRYFANALVIFVAFVLCALCHDAGRARYSVRGVRSAVADRHGDLPVRRGLDRYPAGDRGAHHGAICAADHAGHHADHDPVGRHDARRKPADLAASRSPSCCRRDTTWRFAQAITYRGADLAIVWPAFLWTFLLGALFLGVSLILFRRSVSGG